MQLNVVWNNQGKQALNESNSAWLNNLKQAIFLKQRGLLIILPTCFALLARVKCKNKQKRRFQLLHPDTFIAANISQWQMLHNTNANLYKSPHIPKVETGNQSHTPMVINHIHRWPCTMDEITKQQILGAGIFTPTTDTGYSDTITINPGGSGPQSPSIEPNSQLC